MKTLVFCTAHARTLDTWRQRHERWFRALQSSKLTFDQLLIVDDGSPILPDWPQVARLEGPDLPSEPPDARVVLFHFPDNLGRRAIYDFPGWYRSFALAARYAVTYGFDKVVHIESDAYLVSDRLYDYFNALHEGWTVLWCEKYDFPEIAFQAICGEHVERFHRLTGQDYSRFVGEVHEAIFPYTHVEKRFVGDRYGEALGYVPLEADYVAQVQAGREPEYYWWIDPAVTAEISGAPNLAELGDLRQVKHETLFTLSFDKEGRSSDYALEGWSYQEDQMRWMVGKYSKIALPEIAGFRGGYILLDAFPFVYGEHASQRVQICLNQRVLYTGARDNGEPLSIETPQDCILGHAPNVLEFHHPDAASPAQAGASADARQLSLCVRKIEIVSRIGA